MAVKKSKLNIYRVFGEHPVSGEPVNLRWYRGANRYNHGAIRYGLRYHMRFVIATARLQAFR